MEQEPNETIRTVYIWNEIEQEEGHNKRDEID